MKEKFKAFQKTYIILFILILFAIAFRVYYTSGNKIHFYFDQARDAHISQSIYQNLDFKIQGPSASGTSDSLFHGVYYYYLIGFIYFISGGNPSTATLFLGILNSTVIIPIFFLAKEIAGRKKVGYLAAIIFAFSVDATQMGTYLFNVSLATVTIPWLFFFLWQVFVKKRDKYLPLLALTLGLTHQAAIFLLYFFVIITFLYGWRSNRENRLSLFKAKNFSKSFLIYFALISTMIAAQFKLYQAGIFKLSQASQQLRPDVDAVTNITNILRLYADKIYFTLPFLSKTMSVALFLISIYIFLTQPTKKQNKIFLFLWIFAPLSLYLYVFRDFYHMLVGIIPAIYISVSYLLITLNKTKIQKIIGFLILIVLIYGNISLAKLQRGSEVNRISVQAGAYLNSQLELIDHTYEKAQGEDFSISTLTAPHGINTTWSYLYDWYGKKKYGYTPTWFGPSQVGLPAGGLLKESQGTLPLHFTIYEPNPGTYQSIREEFIELQTIYSGIPQTTLKFGALLLEERTGVN